MKLFSLNFAALIVRFYLLMAIIIVAFFIGQPWLSFLALPVFLTAMMGIKFARPKVEPKSQQTKAPQRQSVQHQHAH